MQMSDYLRADTTHAIFAPADVGEDETYENIQCAAIHAADLVGDRVAVGTVETDHLAIVGSLPAILSSVLTLTDCGKGMDYVVAWEPSGDAMTVALVDGFLNLLSAAYDFAAGEPL